MRLLLDENIHHRVLKLVYNVKYARFNVPMFLNRTPVLLWRLAPIHVLCLMQAEGIIHLSYGCVLVSFSIGRQVRDCLWGSSANCNALYSRCLHVLISVTLGYERKVGYVRTLMVVRLLNHHPWFSRLPGLPFSKEPCIAMLIRVVAKMARYPHMDSFEQVHDMFVLVTSPTKW